MTPTLSASEKIGEEQSIDLHGLRWSQYVAIGDALAERRGLRMIYLDGSLTLLTLSRPHDRYAEYLNQLILAVARGLGLVIDLSGSATLRREDKEAGVEPDLSYYFGDHAIQMSHFGEIDLETQPPPDLVVEVELTHPADRVMTIHARLSVPEVWRFDVRKKQIGFWSLDENGIYLRAERSRHLPSLVPADVLAQLALANSLALLTTWLDQLPGWVQNELVPRLNPDEPQP